jgi:predicted metalloprotease with PDZ domain
MILGLFIAWSASLSLSATPIPIRAEYILKLEPNNETLSVQLNLSNLKANSIIFQIERAYGCDSEDHYANSIQNLVAHAANGTRLPLKRTQNRQWKVDIGDLPCMILEYQADLSCTLTDDHYHSTVTDEYVYINGNQIFIYPLEMDNTDITVQIKSPTEGMLQTTKLQRIIQFFTCFWRLQDSFHCCRFHKRYSGHTLGTR